MNPNAYLRLGLILILMTALAACQGKLFSVQGEFVVEEKRIALQQEGSASGSWQGKQDLTVSYTATRNQDLLQMAGDIVFRRPKMLDTFRFSLVLIDAEGKILDVIPVTTAGGRMETEKIAFSHELTLPPGTRFFAFTYDGTSRGVGQGGSPNAFWSAPW